MYMCELYEVLNHAILNNGWYHFIHHAIQTLIIVWMPAGFPYSGSIRPVCALAGNLSWRENTKEAAAARDSGAQPAASHCPLCSARHIPTTPVTHTWTHPWTGSQMASKTPSTSPYTWVVYNYYHTVIGLDILWNKYNNYVLWTYRPLVYWRKAFFHFMLAI